MFLFAWLSQSALGQMLVYSFEKLPTTSCLPRELLGIEPVVTEASDHQLTQYARTGRSPFPIKLPQCKTLPYPVIPAHK